MTFFTQNRTATYIIAVLIGLNLLSLYFFVVHKRIAHKRHSHEWHDKDKGSSKDARKSHIEYMEKKLGLSKAQKETFDSLRKKHFAAMRPIWSTQKQLRELMFKNIGKPTFNADSVAQLIGEQQQTMEAATYQHFNALRRVCTAEQQPLFDEAIASITKKMNERWSKHKKDKDNSKD